MLALTILEIDRVVGIAAYSRSTAVADAADELLLACQITLAAQSQVDGKSEHDHVRANGRLLAAKAGLIGAMRETSRDIRAALIAEAAGAQTQPQADAVAGDAPSVGEIIGAAASSTLPKNGTESGEGKSTESPADNAAGGIIGTA